MYNYNELYQTCDNILELFAAVRPRLSDSDIASSIQENKSLIRSAIQELITYECIKDDGESAGHWYLLKGKGTQIHEMGGFKEYFKELKRKDELKKILDQYSIKTNQSVIDTNDLVKKNIGTQERLTKYALLIAFIAAAVPIITLVKESVLPTQLIDIETKSIMKNQQKSIDSLKQSLDSVNFSLKNLKTISYYDTSKTKTK